MEYMKIPQSYWIINGLYIYMRIAQKALLKDKIQLIQLGRIISEKKITKFELKL